MIAAHQNRIAQLRDSFKQKMLEADSWPKKVNFIQIVCVRSILCFRSRAFDCMRYGMRSMGAHCIVFKI